MLNSFDLDVQTYQGSVYAANILGSYFVSTLGLKL